MPIYDMHLHTRLSEDAPQDIENTVDSYCKLALKSGFSHLAFTDHKDIITEPGAVNCDLYELERQCDAAKRRYEGKLDIMFGVELAHAHTHKVPAKEILSAHKFDFVLGSLHILSDNTDFYMMDFDLYSDAALKELYSKYLGEIYETARFCDFDSLAHITYPLRYYRKAGRQNVIDLNEYLLQYNEIFDVLIERGKALEINCSTLSEADYNDTMRTSFLIEKYTERGGRLFTIGSDSHFYKDAGFGTQRAGRFLKNRGIDSLCVFKKRKMSLVPLVTE